MGKLKDWARCACHNRATFGGIFGMTSGAGLITYGMLEKDMGVFIAGIASATFSTTLFVATGGGSETLRTYTATKTRLERERSVPGCLADKSLLPYCDRRGVELAVLDHEKESMGALR